MLFRSKTVFVTPFCPRYFHLLLECFPLILELKNKFNLTNLVMTAPMPLDEETGLFVHLTKKYKYPYVDNIQDNPFRVSCLDDIKSDFSIIPDFCKYFDINLICIPEHEFIGTSFDYAYFIYGENNIHVHDDYIFIDRELFNEQGIEKEIEPPNSLIPIKIMEEYANTVSSLEIKKFTNFNILFPLKSRKNPEINSFKILKDNYPKFDIISGKKIYVSRKNSPHRNVSEEEQIEKYFKELNYEIVYFENLTILEQSKVCQESEKIVCLYGTNLLNCGFCSNKTTVISIKYNIPSDSWTINSAYNRIFKENSIKHIELNFTGDQLLPFIKQNRNLW